MSKIPQHEATPRKGKKAARLQAESPLDGAAFVDMTSVAEAIDGFASIFSTFVTQARNGDNGSGLYTDPHGYPVKVALMSRDGDDEAFHSLEIDLTGTAVHSIADSLKRIADAMSKA